MRIGLVSKWFASGQGVVSRQLRSALEEMGHSTFVLARPGRGPRALKRNGAAETGDPAWAHPDVTEAGAHEIGAAEYLRWADENGLDAVLCDENYGFDAIAELRSRGVRTVGRFVWESFAPADAEAASAAYDAIYSLTRCERERYRTLGIKSPLVRWGIHPELLAAAALAAECEERSEDEVRFLFPCSFLGPRRPTRAVLAALRSVRDRRARLILSAQIPRGTARLERAQQADPRVSLVLEDLPTSDYLALFGRSDVLMAPSRWEGLGVPLFEGTAFGLPIVTNDAPPMNEVALDGVNAVLVPSRDAEATKSGIPAQDVAVDGLAGAIERLLDDGERERLAAGARRRREELDWRNTVADLGGLLASLT